MARTTTRVELPHANTATIDGQQIETGTPITVDGIQGEFIFRYVWLPDGSLACFGGQGQYKEWRNFPPHRCHTIRAKRKWSRPRSEEELEVMRNRAAVARAARNR